MVTTIKASTQKKYKKRFYLKFIFLTLLKIKKLKTIWRKNYVIGWIIAAKAAVKSLNF